MVPWLQNTQQSPGLGFDLAQQGHMYVSVRTMRRFASSLTNMLSSTRSSVRKSAASRPRGLRGFARVGLVAAWAVFWLNSAIFPCCESIAAVIGGDHPVEAAKSESAASQLHRSGDANSEGPDHGPDTPCEHTLSAEPALVGEPVVLTSDRFPLHWAVLEEHLALGLTTVVHRPSLALPRADPPPLPRFYLRTQRLLI
jgi:hypothetical protein